ncbi:amidohydrolase family protein [Algoriphagus limi]|uniref:Amidohydrolase family protein n=1 Tax=Algoriphagus limi TaxID=2975273 RepID=A0ABT2G423_9BACT|nr:amidohydrolase family protein [Algoriphagus limi]MCS5490008.1 amidohydrolase family protein [Algoriphagus limi]
MRIDAHQHFWKYHPKRHEWIDESMKSIRRDFLPTDLKPIIDHVGIDGCVAVQAEESLKETDFLLDLAEENDWIQAVVGWVDIGSSDLSKTIDQYSHFTKLKGFREILQAKDPKYMLREEFIKGLQLLHAKGYTYDILVYPHHLSAVLELVKKCEGHSFVIDHLAKPYIKDGEWKEWKKAMKPIAERDFMYAKISGLITEADWKNWNSEQILPYIEIALELFGPDRLMFGSDWPVCLVAGEYETVWRLIEDFTSTLSPHEKDQIMGLTAMKFYKIPQA